jgi:hypothetical protein
VNRFSRRVFGVFLQVVLIIKKSLGIQGVENVNSHCWFVLWWLYKTAVVASSIY